MDPFYVQFNIEDRLDIQHFVGELIKLGMYHCGDKHSPWLKNWPWADESSYEVAFIYVDDAAHYFDGRLMTTNAPVVLPDEARNLLGIKEPAWFDGGE